MQQKLLSSKGLFTHNKKASSSAHVHTLHSILVSNVQFVSTEVLLLRAILSLMVRILFKLKERKKKFTYGIRWILKKPFYF